MAVLDVVVDVQLLEEELQARREPAGKAGRGDLPLAEARGRLIDRAAELAEHRVALEPEPHHAAEVLVALPALARIGLDQRAQVGRPALAGGERERLEFVIGRGRDGHRAVP
jgi:hypothetical protein